jgi:hypothetical protein
MWSGGYYRFVLWWKESKGKAVVDILNLLRFQVGQAMAETNLPLDVLEKEILKGQHLQGNIFRDEFTPHFNRSANIDRCDEAIEKEEPSFSVSIVLCRTQDLLRKSRPH